MFTLPSNRELRGPRKFPDPNVDPLMMRQLPKKMHTTHRTYTLLLALLGTGALAQQDWHRTVTGLAPSIRSSHTHSAGFVPLLRPFGRSSSSGPAWDSRCLGRGAALPGPRARRPPGETG